ncbi:MAG TPA: VirB3 family type IV secretion system protein [Thermoanaerobaculia bacterium]|nr:VirB3 family type IV secretion system protein [Thermoanaerobaculia bacterium]
MPVQATATPLHPSLVRPVLYAGVAPEFLFFEVSTAFLLVFEVGLHVVTVVLSLFYLLALHPIAAHLCAKDPQVAQLYVRSLRGADYYTPSPAFGAPVRSIDPALPGTVVRG